MTTFSGQKISQRPDELEALIELMVQRNARSYLEIGTRHGDTFHAVMSRLPVGSCGVAVDMPEGPWGKRKSLDYLGRACKDLRSRGYEIHLFVGDSKATNIVHAVRAHAQFSACLIDGDHRYEGVKADWENYGALSDLTAFHDIDAECEGGPRLGGGGHLFGVSKLWHEICASHSATKEIIGKKRGMGLGIVFN